MNAIFADVQKGSCDPEFQQFKSCVQKAVSLVLSNQPLVAEEMMHLQPKLTRGYTSTYNLYIHS